MRNIWRFFLVMAMLVLWAGCQQQTLYREPPTPVEAYRADALLGAVRNIAVKPFDGGPAEDASAKIISESIAAALGSKYEVQFLRQPQPGVIAPPEWSLLDYLLAARDQGFDALLVGRINDYHWHQPPRLSMVLRLLSTETGEVLWAAAGDLNSAEKAVEKRVRWYYQEHLNSEKSLHGWRGILMAERRYAAFAADEYLTTMGIKLN